MIPGTTTPIRLDERGVAWIDDTHVKVVEVASEWRATRASAEEMEYQHEGVLTLAQITPPCPITTTTGPRSTRRSTVRPPHTNACGAKPRSPREDAA